MKAWCETAAEHRAGNHERVELNRELRFEAVSFDYEAGVPTVRDLNLGFEAGDTTAIVGPSGSGKSTTADLVMGLLVPTAGRILVDDEPLEGRHVNSWRERIGYVAQDTFLFNDTVRANLLWAYPGAEDEEIRRALRMAAAEEFVDSLPQGLNTMLGDRGVRLSGGEKQRLALGACHVTESLVVDTGRSDKCPGFRKREAHPRRHREAPRQHDHTGHNAQARDRTCRRHDSCAREG